MVEGGLNSEELIAKRSISQAVQFTRVVEDQCKSSKTVVSCTFLCDRGVPGKSERIFLWFALNIFISLPVSATETVLLKYCSSTVHSVSFDFVVTPQNPLQFTLTAADKTADKTGISQRQEQKLSETSDRDG